MSIAPAIALNPGSEAKDVAYALAAGPRCAALPLPLPCPQTPAGISIHPAPRQAAAARRGLPAGSPHRSSQPAAFDPFTRPACQPEPLTPHAPRSLVVLAFFNTANLNKPPGTGKLNWAAASIANKLQQSFEVDSQTYMKQPGGGQLVDTLDGRTQQVMLANGKLYSGACGGRQRLSGPSGQAILRWPAAWRRPPLDQPAAARWRGSAAGAADAAAELTSTRGRPALQPSRAPGGTPRVQRPPPSTTSSSSQPSRRPRSPSSASTTGKCPRLGAAFDSGHTGSGARARLAGPRPLTDHPALPASPLRSLLYYTGYQLWAPTLITNGTATMLVSLMMGPDCNVGGPRVPLTTSITVFKTCSKGTLQPGPTWTFPSKVKDDVLMDPFASGSPKAAHTGRYTAGAVDEQGRMWGGGMVVGRHVDDGPKLSNWATVVFRLA
jgi:hypothetical protein